MEGAVCRGGVEGRSVILISGRQKILQDHDIKRRCCSETVYAGEIGLNGGVTWRKPSTDT